MLSSVFVIGGVTTQVLRKCAIGLSLLATACSPTASPPSFNSPIKPINVEACRNVNLDLRKLDAPKVRILTTCLNGENGALAEYKDFLDSTTDSDLNAVLEVYNRYIYTTDGRLNKILDLVGRMESHGYLDSVYKNIQTLAENQSLQKAMPVARQFLNDENDVLPLARYVRDMIGRDQLSPTLVASANALGGIQARVLAILISRDSAGSVLNVNQTTNLLADIVLRSLGDGNFHGALTHLSDVQLLRGLKTVSDQDFGPIGDLLDFLPAGNTSGNNRMERMRQTINGSDRPLICFQNGSANRHKDHILSFFAKEVSDLDDSGGDKFFLQTVPLLLATGRESCDFHPDLLNNADLLSDITLRGYGHGLRASLGMLLKTNRVQEVARMLKSDYMTQLSPLMEEFGSRSASRFGIELLARDLTDSDYNTISILLNYLVLENLNGVALIDWINLNVAEPSRSLLLSDLNTLATDKRDFINLSGLVSALPDQDSALRDLKDAVARKVFDQSQEASLIKITKKIVSQDPERRRELVDFAQSLKQTLGDSRGGFGMLLSVLAQTTGLNTDKPVQDLVHDVVSDEELLRRTLPVLYKWFGDSRFQRTIDLTGRIAGNGQLNVLVKFLVEVFKNSQGANGMGNGIPSTQYVPPTGDPQAVVQSITPFAPVPPPGDYSACLGLNGSLFGADGQNLYQGLKCINATGAAPVLATVAEQLKEAKLLDSTAQLLRTMLVTSPYMLGTLTEIERIFRSGELEKLLKLLSISGESPYLLPYRLDGILTDAFSHGGADSTLQLLAKIFQIKDFTKAGIIALNLKNQTPQKIFESDNNYRIKITSDQNVIKTMKKKIKDNSNFSQAQIDAAFAQAVENFETRNDAWLYEEGLYPHFDNTQWKQQILASLKESLRTTDLKEIVMALQDLHRNYNIPKFLLDSIKTQRMAANYMPDGSRRFHIVTRLDQLETLVNVSDVDVPIGGIHHVGTDFQLNIIKATDLSEMVKSKHSDLNLAIVIYGNSNRGIHLKNMEENITALQEIADNGDARILKRLYIALQNATPDEYKWKDDPVNNHLGSLSHLSYIGAFNLLAVSLTHLAETGSLERIVNSILSVIDLIGADDIEPLRKLIEVSLTAAQEGAASPMEQLMDKLLAVEQSPEGFKNFKDALFHVLANIEKPNQKVTSLLQGLPFLMSQPTTWTDMLSSMMEDIQDPKGGTLKLGANLLTLDAPSWDIFRKLLDTLLTAQDSRNAFLLPPMIKLISDGYGKRPGDFSQMNSAMALFHQDPRVVVIKPGELLKGIFAGASGQSGVGDGLAYLLQDDLQRKRLLDVGYVISKNNNVSGLSRLLIQEIDNGHMDRALHFIFDNLASSSVR